MPVGKNTTETNSENGARVFKERVVLCMLVTGVIATLLGLMLKFFHCPHQDGVLTLGFGMLVLYPFAFGPMRGGLNNFIKGYCVGVILLFLMFKLRNIVLYTEAMYMPAIGALIIYFCIIVNEAFIARKGKQNKLG